MALVLVSVLLKLFLRAISIKSTQKFVQNVALVLQFVLQKQSTLANNSRDLDFFDRSSFVEGRFFLFENTHCEWLEVFLLEGCLKVA